MIPQPCWQVHLLLQQAFMVRQGAQKVHEDDALLHSLPNGAQELDVRLFGYQLFQDPFPNLLRQGDGQSKKSQ